MHLRARGDKCLRPMHLASRQENPSHALPVRGVTLGKRAELHDRTQTQLTQVVPMLLNEGENLIPNVWLDIFPRKELAARGNVLDPETNGLTVMETQIQVEAT